MTYNQFKTLAAERKWTLAQLRCDEQPTEELVELMDVLGLNKYERFVSRYWQESEAFTVGDQVRFREVVDPGDAMARMVVIEDNGDRVIVRAVCDLPIPPTAVYLRSDLCKA